MGITKVSTAGMSRQEWERARLGSIGGSDAAAVIGLNRFKSPYTLWAEKTGAVIPEDISGKEAVRLGNYLEQYVAERFTEETGKKVRRETAILKNTDYPFAHANVDRMVVGEKAGLECKTTSGLNMKRFRNGEYPDNYYVQCMHYMAVTGYPVWYLAVLIGNSDFRVFRIERDEIEIGALMEAEADFWKQVEEKTPPAVDGSPGTADTLDMLYPADDSLDTADLTPVCGILREYLELKRQLNEIKARMDAAANEIKQYMGGAVYGQYDSAAVSWKAVSTSRFDKAAFQKEHPEIDLGKYQKKTTSRRFEVKEAKI